MVGAGPPPLWGRGRQGRNTVAAETGSLRLEFPSCYGPELRNPQQLCLTRQLLQSPSLYHLPLLPLKPLLLPGYKHTQHMAAPGLSTLAKTPGGRSHRHHGSLPSHMLLGPERTPNSQSPSCDQLPLACGSQFYPTFHPGSAHFRDGNTDLKVAKLGQDQPDSSDLAQLGREWEGWRGRGGQRPPGTQAAHQADPGEQQVREPASLHAGVSLSVPTETFPCE